MSVSEQLKDWKLGALAGLAVVLITLIPQITLWAKTGSDWQGTYAYTDTDELAYSAYLNSQIHGRPRRNNPEAPNAQTPLHESIYSIQFIPPLMVASLARLLGLSASTAFIILTPLMAFISSIAVFSLLKEVTHDPKTAAIGVLLILLCGVLVSTNLITFENPYAVFSFLRRYVPSVAFPGVFLFCVLILRAYSRQDGKSLWLAMAAGLIFGFLVYSYFFLWSAVAAWFLCFTLLWLIVRANDRKHVLRVVATCGAIMVAVLIPYFLLLDLRMHSTDVNLGLVSTRIPDLFRSTEIIGAAIMVALAFGARSHRLGWNSPGVLFAASCAVVPFIVFNQQVVTGRSLQPFHYEQFVLNYLILVGAVITDYLLWKLLLRRPWFAVALALVVGTTLAIKTSATNLQANVTRDEAISLFTKLDEDARRSPSPGAALFDRTLISASSQTTCSSLPLLWSLFTYTYGTMSRDEERERLFQYFYYLRVDGAELERRLTHGSVFKGALFGLPRVNKTLTQNFEPITQEEVKAQVKAYDAYVTNFSRQHAERWPLSYVILVKDHPYDLSNLDKWYKRDNGELMGSSVVYRVRLRGEVSNNAVRLQVSD